MPQAEEHHRKGRKWSLAQRRKFKATTKRNRAARQAKARAKAAKKNGAGLPMVIESIPLGRGTSPARAHFAREADRLLEAEPGDDHRIVAAVAIVIQALVKIGRPA